VKEAVLYDRTGDGAVKCRVCPHACVIKEGALGVCRVRRNEGGTLYSLNYGKPVTLNNDPIEKKPLFHFLPGTRSLSLAAVGCNLTCDHCQNWSISQWPRDREGWTRLPGDEVRPAVIAEEAVEACSSSISYTYTEPTVYLEFALDVMSEARARGLKNVFVTNGYMSQESAEAAASLLDAANVDLKSSSDEFYKKTCGGRVGPVMETIGRLHAAGVWVEVTTLVIPGHNDSEIDLRTVAGFLASTSPDIPWHVSAFHPDYRLTNAQRTPVHAINAAMRYGREAGLRFVYAGNVPGNAGENTVCPYCGDTLIERRGFKILSNRLHGGRCESCGKAIPGHW
jgi:pyruvate formate lyase activating enzyme